METRKPAKSAKLRLALATVAVISIPAGATLAATVTGTAQFLSSVVLTPANMSFGRILFSGPPVAGSTVTLKTDSSTPTYAGVFSQGTGGAAITSGIVGIAASPGSTLDVDCDATGVLGDGASSTILIDTIRVKKESAADAAATTCNGVGGGVTMSFAWVTGTDDEIELGGRINGATLTGAFAGGSYSTAAGNGTAINVTVVYQ